MPYLVLPSRWARQPQGTFDVDWSHPLTRELEYLLVGSQRYLNPTKRVITRVIAEAPIPTVQGIGTSISEAEYEHYPLPVATGGTTPWTYAGLFLPIVLSASNANPDGNAVAGICEAPGTSTAWDRMIYLQNTTQAWRGALYDGATKLATSTATAAVGKLDKVIVTSAGTLLTIAVDGVPDVSTVTTNNGYNAYTSAEFCLGNPVSAGGINQTAVPLFLRTRAHWPDTHRRAFFENPWQIFKPIQRRIYVPSAGGATAYTLTADSGSFTLTGTDAGLALGRQLSAEAVAFTLSGTAAGLAHGRAVTAEAGAFTFTGTAAGLAIGRQLSAESGSFALTGTDATLEWSGAGAKTIDAEAGAFALTGTDAGLALGRKLVPEAGSFTLTGTAATLTHGYTLVAENGDFAVTGSDAALSTTGTVVIEPSKGAGGKRKRAKPRRILEEAELTPEQREALGLPPVAAPKQPEAAPKPPKRAKRTGKASRGIQLQPEAVAPSADEIRAAEILAQRTAELMAQQQAMRAEGMAMLQAAAAIEAENEMIMLLLMAA